MPYLSEADRQSLLLLARKRLLKLFPAGNCQNPFLRKEFLACDGVCSSRYM